MGQRDVLPPHVIGLIIGGIGVVITLIFVFADALGVGSHPTRFGTGQTVGTVVGVLVLMVGVLIYFFGETPPHQRE